MATQSPAHIGLLLLDGLYQAIFPHDRKVQKYLAGVSHDSIRGDLLRVFKPALRHHEYRFSSLFRAFCIHDSDTQADYWTEGCFMSYIRTTRDSSIITDSTISLLWRSFSYYAYHPCPLGGPYQIRMNEDAFLCGAALLALQTNDLLGTQEDDWFWRHDDAYFQRRSWERMLRSLAVPGVQNRNKNGDIDKWQREARVSDIMDVLSMTQPHTPMPKIPSPAQLEPVSNKLYEDETISPSCVYETTKDEVQTLIELLARLRPAKQKWGMYFTYGHLNESSKQGAELANLFAQSSFFASPEKRKYGYTITADDVTRMMVNLPNLHFRFLQLWAFLFQPQAQPFEISVTPQAPIAVFDNLFGLLSLLVPQVAALARYEERFGMHDTRIAFTETPLSFESDKRPLAITRLVKSLSEKRSKSMVQGHYLVLFTHANIMDNQDSSHPDCVLGLYIPGPLILIDEHEGEPVYSNSLASSSDCMLLYLGPDLRLAKWRGHGYNLMEILTGDTMSAEGSKITELALGRIAMGSPKAEEKLLSELPYWIGAPHSDPRAVQTGLHIDPNKQTVTLIQNTLAEQSSGFESLGTEACEIRISDAIMHVFTVSGDSCRGAWTPVPSVKDLSRYRRNENEILVAGEELKSRIEGFGAA